MEQAVVPTSLDNRAEAAMRLRPDMTSRRLLVLAFVRDYITKWGASPSYGEIANGLCISPTRARQLVKALVLSGQLLRRPGPRGLSLPTLREEALRLLREHGYVIDEDVFHGAIPCAHSTLRRPVLIDYVDGRTVERRAGNSGGAEDEPGGPTTAAAGRTTRKRAS
jgi:hypothetical protein